ARHCDVRRSLPFASIAVADQDGATSGAVAGFDVAPAVADHEAFGQRDSVARGSADEHSGLRLAAVAIVRIVVLADLDRVDRQPAGKVAVDARDLLARNPATRDVRLIGHHDEAESMAAQQRERIGRVRDDHEIGERVGRIGLPVAYVHFVEYAVTIEKYRTRHAQERYPSVPPLSTLRAAAVRLGVQGI